MDAIEAPHLPNQGAVNFSTRGVPTRVQNAIPSVGRFPAKGQLPTLMIEWSIPIDQLLNPSRALFH